MWTHFPKPERQKWGEGDWAELVVFQSVGTPMIAAAVWCVALGVGYVGAAILDQLGVPIQ
jgi:hypothetical protein